MLVRLREDAHYSFEEGYVGTSHLDRGKLYEVLNIYGDYVVLLDMKGNPMPHEICLFEVVDETVPKDWITCVNAWGIWSATPPELAADDFFSRFHDGEAGIVEAFRDYVLKRGLVNNQEWNEIVRDSEAYWARVYRG